MNLCSPSLSRDRVEEFRRLYKKEFGEEICYEEAERIGIALILHVKSLLVTKKQTLLQKPDKKVL